MSGNPIPTYPKEWEREQDRADKKPEVGRKNDSGKPRFDLIPPCAELAVAQVLTHGAEQYGAGNWRHVTEPMPRYTAALLRHIGAWRRGERRDPESGLHHLAHAVANLLFLLEFDLGSVSVEQVKADGFATAADPVSESFSNLLRHGVPRGAIADVLALEREESGSQSTRLPLGRESDESLMRRVLVDDPWG